MPNARSIDPDPDLSVWGALENGPRALVTLDVFMLAVAAVHWAVTIRYLERLSRCRYVDVVGNKPVAGRLPLPRVDFEQPHNAMDFLMDCDRTSGRWALPTDVPEVLRLAISALEGYRPPERRIVSGPSVLRSPRRGGAVMATTRPCDRAVESALTPARRSKGKARTSNRGRGPRVRDFALSGLKRARDNARDEVDQLGRELAALQNNVRRHGRFTWRGADGPVRCHDG